MTFFIRTDASTTIGTGHIMRTFVLAKKLSERGGNVIYVTKPLPGNLDEKIKQEGFGHISLDDKSSEADSMLKILRDAPDSIVIIDHYGIDAQIEQQIKEHSNTFLMVFDDTFESHHADILLNQNIYATDEAYGSLIPSKCRIFTGTNYALLRNEFFDISRRKRTYPVQQRLKVLITLGGSDPDNITLSVMKALESITEYSLHITVIIGSSNPNRALLEQFAQLASHTFELKSNVATMAALMQQSDIAITAAGSTVLETMRCTLPSILITLAPNQERNTHYMCSHQLALESGMEPQAIAAAFRRLASDPILYTSISENLERITIGSGVDRLITILIQSLYNPEEVPHD